MAAAAAVAAAAAPCMHVHAASDVYQLQDLRAAAAAAAADVPRGPAEALLIGWAYVAAMQARKHGPCQAPDTF